MRPGPPEGKGDTKEKQPHATLLVSVAVDGSLMSHKAHHMPPALFHPLALAQLPLAHSTSSPLSSAPPPFLLLLPARPQDHHDPQRVQLAREGDGAHGGHCDGAAEAGSHRGGGTRLLRHHTAKDGAP